MQETWRFSDQHLQDVCCSLVQIHVLLVYAVALFPLNQVRENLISRLGGPTPHMVARNISDLEKFGLP